MKIQVGLQLWLVMLYTGRTSRRYEEIADAPVVVIGCLQDRGVFSALILFIVIAENGGCF